MSAALPNVVSILDVARVELAQDLVCHDIGEADDRVERGAQLVRHVGEEGAFRLARRLRLTPRLGQPLLSFLDVAEIADHQEKAALLQRAAADAQPATVGKTKLPFGRWRAAIRRVQVARL